LKKVNCKKEEEEEERERKEIFHLNSLNFKNIIESNFLMWD